MAAPLGTVKVTGLRELQRALKAMDRELSREIDNELKNIAQVVAGDARQRFSAINAKSAAGFKPRMRGFGHVVVAQTRRSTNTHPEFGALQMVEALIPALWARADDVERGMETMLTHLERKHGL